MKNEKFSNSLMAFFLATFISLSGIACLATAFSLNVASWGGIVLWGAGFTLAAILFFQFQWGILVFTALGMLALNTLLRTSSLMDSITSVVTHITALYDRGYHWGYLQWGDVTIADVASDGFLCLLCSLVSVCIAWVLMKKLPLVFATLAGLFPMILCCILRDTGPDLLPLWLLMSGLALMLLSRSTCRLDSRRAARLIARLLIPVMLFTGMVFIWAPKVPYEAPAQAILDYFLGLWESQAQGPGSDATGPTIFGPDFIPYMAEPLDLSQAGPIDLGKKQVMRISSQLTGVLYLRDQAYDTYTGTGWLITADSNSENGWPITKTAGSKDKRIHISTMSSMHYRYIPYYISGSDWTVGLANGVLQNPDGTRNYFYTVQTVPEGAKCTPLNPEEENLYTLLPSDTVWAAQEHLNVLFTDEQVYTVAEQANIIAEYVKNSATYSKDTSKMPADESDFAVWFLNSSETGYCIHFATAATVLLRTAGIPARYVSGYMTTLSSQGRATVIADEAHAWVEYFHPEKGWTVLEATPADPATQPTEPTKPAPTDPTEPSKAPTDPTEATNPPATRPTAPTSPTKPSGGPISGTPAKPMDWTWLIVCAQILLLIGILMGQHRLRKHLRYKWLHTGNSNQQAVRRWKYLRRISRLTGYHVNKELYYLTEKAVFSQYLLTDEELSRYDTAIGESFAKLSKRKPLIRFLCKLLLAQ